MSLIDDLRHAHEALRAAVLLQRKKAHKEDGKLAKAFREAMEMWDDMKAKGATLAEFIPGLENVLRQAWMKSDGDCACPRCRWACPYCEDIGAIFEERPVRIYAGRTATFVVPCRCPKGARFIEKPRGGDDFRAAGKTGPTRVGR